MTEMSTVFPQTIDDAMKFEKAAEMIKELMCHPLFIPFPTSIEDSYKFGWARGIAFVADSVYQGNWHKWLEILAAGEYVNGDPVPVIELSASGNSEVTKMLNKAMQTVYVSGVGMYEFVEWIGYALGISWFKKPKISEKEWKYLYENIDFSLYFKYPADYLSVFLAENGQSGVLDFFPTPMSVAALMAKILEADDYDYSTSVIEPCLGTGALVLSSKALNIVGTELSHLVVRAAAIQAFFYKPSMLYVPHPVIGLHFSKEEMRLNRFFEFDTNTRIYCGDTLFGEFMCPKNIFQEDSEMIDVYLMPMDLSKNELYQYRNEMLKDWAELDAETKFKIVKAQARNLGFQQSLSNPPFSAKYDKERAEMIQKKNEEFLKKFEDETVHPLIAAVEKEIEEKIELTLTENSKGKISKDQLMFVF